jgi:hypothetical protein
VTSCNVTKAAAFCLGNLVRGSEENGAALVGLGGVEALIDVINDVHDDDASKKVEVYLSPSHAADCCDFRFMAYRYRHLPRSHIVVLLRCIVC